MFEYRDLVEENGSRSCGFQNGVATAEVLLSPQSYSDQPLDFGRLGCDSPFLEQRAKAKAKEKLWNQCHHLNGRLEQMLYVLKFRNLVQIQNGYWQICNPTDRGEFIGR